MSVVPSGRSWSPLLVVGDIEADAAWVRTPSGVAPIGAVSWDVQNHARREQGIPTWAVVCAIVFALACLLGLLFLLVKEDRVTGWLVVTVRAPGFEHATQVPVWSDVGIANAYAQVNHGRLLTAAAG